jgi:hypothetical protein
MSAIRRPRLPSSPNTPPDWYSMTGPRAAIKGSPSFNPVYSHKGSRRLQSSCNVRHPWIRLSGSAHFRTSIFTNLLTSLCDLGTTLNLNLGSVFDANSMSSCMHAAASHLVHPRVPTRQLAQVCPHARKRHSHPRPIITASTQKRFPMRPGSSPQQPRYQPIRRAWAFN